MSNPIADLIERVELPTNVCRITPLPAKLFKNVRVANPEEEGPNVGWVWIAPGLLTKLPEAILLFCVEMIEHLRNNGFESVLDRRL